MKLQRWLVLSVAASCLLATAVIAAAPKLMSYQGRATDPSGNPVADGPHTVRFDLYNSATTGSSLWNEQTSVTTSGGLFTHTLGSVIPILESQFRYYEGLWLQVTFDGEVQTPRTQFTSVGYAFHVQSIHNADGGNIRNGVAIYDPYTDNEIAGLYADGAGSSQLWLEGGDVDQSYRNVKLDAATGHLRFIDRTAGYDTATYGVSSIKLADNALEIDATGIDMRGELYIAGTTSVSINSNATGNGSVYLPDAAIGKREILDEPGIAQAIFDSTSPKRGGQGSFVDIVSLEITIPSSGYILLSGQAKLSGLSSGVVQIDDAGGGSNDDVTTYYYVPIINEPHRKIHLSRVFYKTAGTHTFRIEALSTGLADIELNEAVLTAIYFPTSYGTVETLAPAAEAGDFEHAVPIQSDGVTKYKVDLRGLELRAAKAEAEAERAKRELLEAQQGQ